MSKSKILLAGVLPIALFLLAAGPAAARRNDPSVIDPSEFMQRAPEVRAQELRDGLAKFMAEHKDLTSEQTSALQNLAAIEDSASFTYTLDPNKKDIFAKRLAELAGTLSYRDYLTMVRSFDVELRVWMVHNELATSAAADTPHCNCAVAGTVTGCSPGFACRNITCIHDAGTTYYGICVLTNPQDNQ